MEQADSGVCSYKTPSPVPLSSIVQELKRGEGKKAGQSFYEVSMTLTLSPDKIGTRKGKFKPTSPMNINVKILNKTSKWDPIICDSLLVFCLLTVN